MNLTFAQVVILSVLAKDLALSFGARSFGSTLRMTFPRGRAVGEDR